MEHFKPLVIGAPRSGFALLCSVVIHFGPLERSHATLRQNILNVILRGVGDHIADSIVSTFGRHGVTRDLLYNENFRYIAGGPKWISRDRPEDACFRKYVGVRGKGDFTIVTRHPREVLNLDAVVHSHTDPALWLAHPGFCDYEKFASVRSPVGILSSSVFSINALASEYIQKFVPPQQDNDGIRQELALYKLTDMEFFEGLVKFLVKYFDEFMEVHDQYIIMRWEDLIRHPVATIMRLADEGGVSVNEQYAAKIWGKLDHVNLTQAHKHNYRVGHGVVDGWRSWITNDHLGIIRDYGFEKHMAALGYGTIEMLNECDYTPFQEQVSVAIRSGRILDRVVDRDLFTFAFNKSNLMSDKFIFKRYAWKANTQIERAAFGDEQLLFEVWESAEQACGELNGFIEEYLLESDNLNGVRMIRLLDGLCGKYKGILGPEMGERFERTFAMARCVASEKKAFGVKFKAVKRLGRKVIKTVKKMVCEEV